MPTFDPDLVPTIAPGTLFQRFTEDTSINIRWFTAQDPVYFEVLNRVPADLALRQLIIAKTLDQLNLRLGHQALFPYILQPRVVSGTSNVDVPLSMIWDMHVSLPVKWENVRLARIKRISGINTGTDPVYTGKLLLVFTANAEGSSVEVAVFQAEVELDSDLLYQIVRVEIPVAADEPTAIDPGEASTVGGFIIFRTLNQDDSGVESFLDAVAPPIGGTIDDDGEYTTPETYEIADSASGGVTESDDFSLAAVVHGTGLLTSSAWNALPDLNSDVQTIINTLNYPYSLDATRTSTSPSGIEIPQGIFREFNIVAPASDEPTDDVSGSYYPVYVSRIVRDDVAADTLTFYFATYTVDATPSTVPIEFASLTLLRTYEAGRVVAIVPVTNLFGVEGSEDANWQQGFGRGSVVLSSLWGATSSEVSDFFDSFIAVIDDPAEVSFAKAATRISTWGLSRVPKTIPTAGQADAMTGSRAGVSDPSISNRFVVEGDQGAGDTVDFSTHPALAEDVRENADIERYGYTGSLAHRIVKLVVNASGTRHVYSTDILPRLVILFGRNPVFGDEWYDGVRFKKYNGETWVG